MLTHGRERDVLDQDDLVVILGEDGFQLRGRIAAHPVEDFLVHAGDALGRVAQSLPVRVFADGFQDHPAGGYELLVVEHDSSLNCAALIFTAGSG